MADITPLRGRLYRAKLGDLPPKNYLVVSNNARNAALDTVLAVRMTTTPKPALASIVELGDRMPGFEGRFVCDNIVEIWKDELLADIGAAPREVMRDIEAALQAALGIR